MNAHERPNAPKWMSQVLWAATIYNIFWGAFVVIFPRQTLSYLGLDDANHLEIWQSLGMVVGVYGIAYGCAALNPLRHWPITLVGFLGKLFGPIGFLFSAISGNLPWRFGILNIFNDLIWLIPFFLILRRVYQQQNKF